MEVKVLQVEMSLVCRDESFLDRDERFVGRNENINHILLRLYPMTYFMLVICFARFSHTITNLIIHLEFISKR